MEDNKENREQMVLPVDFGDVVDGFAVLEVDALHLEIAATAAAYTHTRDHKTKFKKMVSRGVENAQQRDSPQEVQHDLHLGDAADLVLGHALDQVVDQKVLRVPLKEAAHNRRKHTRSVPCLAGAGRSRAPGRPVHDDGASEHAARDLHLRRRTTRKQHR